MDLLDTLNIVIKSIEKFVMVPEKKNHLNIGGFENEKFKSDSNNFILKKLLFLRRKFFSGTITNFSMDFMTMFKVSKRSTQSSSLRQYKNHDRTAHQYDCMSGKVKNVWILKFESQTLTRIF